MENLEQEVWLDVPGWDGLYQASSFGRIKSRKNKNEIIMNPYLHENGYLALIFHDGPAKMVRVNRIIAQTFLGLDINNKTLCACHKDDIRTNNRVDNLFIGTHKENIQDMIRKGRQGYRRSSVLQYSKEGEFIREWDCISDVAKFLNIPRGNISKVCNGKYKTSGNFVWKYKDMI